MPSRYLGCKFEDNLMNNCRGSARKRANQFCQRFGLRIPILEAPMAGACPPSLAAAVANAGGMGALGALTTRPDGILDWAKEYRAQSNGSFQINLWIPDPAPTRDKSAELRVREFLSQWGPAVAHEAGDIPLHDFARSTCCARRQIAET
jgi:nitronate monooxygenase